MWQVTTQNLNRTLNDLRVIGRGDIANQGIADGLNKALRPIRRKMYADIEKELGATLAGFNKTTTFIPATKTRQWAAIILKGDTISLARYRARQVQSGVTVLVYNRNGRKLVSKGKAFRLKTKGRPVMLRDPDTKAVVTLKGPSVPSTYRDPTKQDHLLRHINTQRVDNLIARQLQYRIRQQLA